jgi:20S proteasome alpha/beta subunit
MTMCLGVNLGDAVALAADGRRTMSSGERVDDVQKLLKITDTLWSAGAGTLSMSAYLQAVLAERQPVNVAEYLKTVQTFARKALRTHAELYDTLARQPGHADFTGAIVMSVLLVGGLDPASGSMVLIGFASGDGFEPHPVVSPSCIGGRSQDQQAARALLRDALRADERTPEDVAKACERALKAVAKFNPDIGPTGHVVIVRRTGSELRSF